MNYEWFAKNVLVMVVRLESEIKAYEETRSIDWNMIKDTETNYKKEICKELKRYLAEMQEY